MTMVEKDYQSHFTDEGIKAPRVTAQSPQLGNRSRANRCGKNQI